MNVNNINYAIIYQLGFHQIWSSIWTKRYVITNKQTSQPFKAHSFSTEYSNSKDGEKTNGKLK